jgi:hypothetical protein
MKTLLVSMVLALAAAGPGVAKTDNAMVCTITGEQVEECCCVEKDGKMICTLTGEVVSSCCCTAAAN